MCALSMTTGVTVRVSVRKAITDIFTRRIFLRLSMICTKFQNLRRMNTRIFHYIFSVTVWERLLREITLKSMTVRLLKLCFAARRLRIMRWELLWHFLKFQSLFTVQKKPNHFLNNSTFKGYNGNSSVPNSWLSENAENVTAYNDDELCGFVFTTNGFINLFKLQKGAFNAKDWNVSNENLPIFVIAGSDDPVIGSKEKFGKLVLFLKKLGYNNADATLYKNNRHEILNEKNKLEIYADVLNFFELK